MSSKIASKPKVTKKRVVISYENLSPELIEALKERYPFGFTDNMIRVDRPNGEFFYGVVLETEDSSYLVKISVKIDDKAKEEIEKDLFADEDAESDEIKGAEDIADVADGDDE